MPVYTNPYTVDNQEIIIAIEVDKMPATTGPYRDLRDGSESLEKARDLFGDGLNLAKNCAVRVVNDMKDMNRETKPDEFQLQFAIKLDTEVGAIIAKSSAGAQLQVTMTWKSDKDEEKDVKEVKEEKND